MEVQKMLDAAVNAGFVKAMVMKVEDLVFVPEYRVFCEQNDCGNFGINYGCPPDCGTPKEMEEKVCRYEKALVLQSRTPVENILDDGETRKIKKSHNALTIKLIKQLEEQGMEMDGFPIMAGPCGFCEVCRKQRGEPCINKEMCFSCLSAFCIDAAKMAKQCGMEMQWNGDVVSFFSIYIFNLKDAKPVSLMI